MQQEKDPTGKGLYKKLKRSFRSNRKSMDKMASKIFAPIGESIMSKAAGSIIGKAGSKAAGVAVDKIGSNAAKKLSNISKNK